MCVIVNSLVRVKSGVRRKAGGSNSKSTYDVSPFYVLGKVRFLFSCSDSSGFRKEKKKKNALALLIVWFLPFQGCNLQILDSWFSFHACGSQDKLILSSMGLPGGGAVEMRCLPFCLLQPSVIPFLHVLFFLMWVREHAVVTLLCYCCLHGCAGGAAVSIWGLGGGGGWRAPASCSCIARRGHRKGLGLPHQHHWPGGMSTSHWYIFFP